MGWREDGNSQRDGMQGILCLPPYYNPFSKVFGANNVEIVTKTRTEHMSAEDKQRAKANKNPLLSIFGPQVSCCLEIQKNISSATGDRNWGCIKQCRGWNFFWSWFSCFQDFWPVSGLPGESGIPYLIVKYHPLVIKLHAWHGTACL